MMVTVIGRGHSGTRAMSHTLSASGVFMGCPQNESGDMLPPEAMYEACRVFGRYVRRKGDIDWDFSAVHAMEPPREFKDLIHAYLQVVLDSPAPRRGWKIPETTLVYPWILRMFPDLRYVFWVRDPRDCVLGAHLTDDLDRFGVPWSAPPDARLRRAISWKYQYDLVKSTPAARHWIEVRFEDFVLRQQETLQRLERFFGFSMGRIPVRPETVGRWKKDTGVHDFEFLHDAMEEYGHHPSGSEEPAAVPAC